MYLFLLHKNCLCQLKKIYNILQLRLHPSIYELKKKIDQGPNDKIYDIDLTYLKLELGKLLPKISQVSFSLNSLVIPLICPPLGP